MADDFGLKVGEYNSSLPTLTDGDKSELQLDSNGRLLVQADVTVLTDFLGLNGAGDSSNILVVGTEDGTSSGTAHALRLASNGAVIIDDGGSSITVDGSVTVSATDLDIRDLSASQDNVAISDGTDTLAINADGSINVGNTVDVSATDLDIRDLSSATDSVEVLQDTHDDLNVNANIQVGDADVDNANPVPVSDAGGSLTVDATDLDIRDLSASTDNVAISDGTDTLAIEADGSINVNASFAALGSEEYNATDDLADAGDGEVSVTAAYTDVVSVAVGVGQTAYVYGYQWGADKNAQARLITDTSGTIVTYKTALNSSAMPMGSEHFSEGGRIEIAGAAGRSVKIQVKKRGNAGTANATGSLHIRVV
jgi:biopolymer transport protein ExbD